VEVHRHDLGLSLDELTRDARAAIAGWDWERGAFGQALSLPAASAVHPYRRYGFENHPFTDVLSRCPSFRALFDSFACEKISFRLLRMGPHAAYGWHHDRWKGRGVVRFQIPILSDGGDDSLILTDYEHVRQLRPRADVGLLFRRFDEFAAANAGHFRVHRLEPGKLHYFDTTKIHTLVNASSRERVTLSFDVHANDWLLARFPEVRSEVGVRPPPLPQPKRWRLGLGFAASQLHPVRNRVHRWLRSRSGGAAMPA
jgi:hypothetical protein